MSDNLPFPMPDAGADRMHDRSPASGTNDISWLTASGWIASLVFGVFLFSFLFHERGAAKAHIRWAVDGRHEIRVLFRSADAVSNLEHALFGFSCALAGFIAANLLHYLTPQTVSPSPSRANARDVDTVVRRPQSIPFVHLAFRIACTGGVVAALLMYRALAFSEADSIAGIWVFALAMCLVWGWRTALYINERVPGVTMLAVAVGVWLEYDLAWKITKIATHENTVPHAAWHLTWSLGVLLGSVALFRCVAMRRSKQTGASVAPGHA